MEGPAVKVAILGASGYAGGELVRLLASHPSVEVVYLGAKDSAGTTLAESHPHLASTALAGATLEPIEAGAVSSRAEIVFCSLPHGASAELAPALVEAGARVVDLAGDYRLPASAYPPWYGFDHPAPHWLDKAVYGLPELFADQIAGAQLVANPGCYPTPVVLGLAPLLRASLVTGPLVVDGKTGLSGAGRAATEATTYASTEESIRPYRFPNHQHTPEMERGIELASGVQVDVSFIPHLVPSVRGVLVTCYARLSGEDVTTDELIRTLEAAYRPAPFVRVLQPGRMADTKRTRGSNVVELQAVADPRTGSAVVLGALDNLVKGAAGQAVQNLNVMLGLPETTALPVAGIYP